MGQDHSANSAASATILQQKEQTAGVGMAASAFFMWGLLPIYFNIIGSGVLAWEILIHRILWAVPLLILFIALTHRGARVRAAFGNSRTLLVLAITAMLITVNWGLFIWASTHGHIIEASMGYYINPLLNVLLGLVILKERLRRLQGIAVAIAAIGVLVMIVGYGKVPWISLVLACSFGSYGLIRKQAPVDNVSGLFIETVLLAPGALIWLAWLYTRHEAAFMLIDARTNWLLIGCGLITITPLILFIGGAKRLRFGTLGLLQYITPTLQFLSGVFIYGEAFTHADAITFAFIWLGLVLYTTDTLYFQHQQHRLAAQTR